MHLLMKPVIDVVYSSTPTRDGCTFNMLVEIWSNVFKFPSIKVLGHYERRFWMSVFLFAYGVYSSLSVVLVPTSVCGGM
jgi:hypothetical protein